MEKLPKGNVQVGGEILSGCAVRAAAQIARLTPEKRICHCALTGTPIVCSVGQFCEVHEDGDDMPFTLENAEHAIQWFNNQDVQPRHEKR